jgi:CheY-like chemotaxis protein
MVHLMGGEIGVESQRGIGSTFWFTVKLARLGGAGDGGVPARLVSCEGARGLCVMANPTERRIVWRYLTAAGVRTDVAASPAQAASLLEAAVAVGHPYQYAFVDLDLPEVTGKEVIERVRTEAKLAGTCVVGLLNRFSGQAYNGGAALSVQGQVFKPVKRLAVWQALQNGAGAGHGAAERKLEELPAPQTRGNGAVSAPEPDRGKTAILLVEDNLVNQKVVLSQLKKLGFSATLAANGSVAVEAALGSDYALILMDIQMPKMDGLEATRRLRAAEEGTARHVPIVALTANAADGDRTACLAAGMDDYLSKPIRLEQLAHVVKQWLT